MTQWIYKQRFILAVVSFVKNVTQCVKHIKISQTSSKKISSNLILTPKHCTINGWLISAVFCAACIFWFSIASPGPAAPPPCILLSAITPIVSSNVIALMFKNARIAFLSATENLASQYHIHITKIYVDNTQVCSEQRNFRLEKNCGRFRNIFHSLRKCSTFETMTTGLALTFDIEVSPWCKTLRFLKWSIVCPADANSFAAAGFLSRFRSICLNYSLYQNQFWWCKRLT